MNSKFIFFCSMITVLSILNSAQSSNLIKSELTDDKQNCTVYLTPRLLSALEISQIIGNKEYCSNDSLKEEAFTHQNFYRKVSQDELTELLISFLEYPRETPLSQNTPLENIKEVNFIFKNISSKPQCTLLARFINNEVNSKIYDISEGDEYRLKSININYAYANDFIIPTEKFPEVVKFEESIKDYKERKMQIYRKNQQSIEDRRGETHDFGKRNGFILKEDGSYYNS